MGIRLPQGHDVVEVPPAPGHENRPEQGPALGEPLGVLGCRNAEDQTDGGAETGNEDVPGDVQVGLGGEEELLDGGDGFVDKGSSL